MSASHEWCEYHLTPRGWEVGAYQWDFGKPHRPEPPSDRVLTVEVHERMSSPFSKTTTKSATTWRSNNSAEIERLYKQFGPHPSTVSFGDH